jgi:hypothetical protein
VAKAKRPKRKSSKKKSPKRKKSAQKSLRRNESIGRNALLATSVNYSIEATSVSYSSAAIEQDVKIAMSEIKPGLQPAQINRSDTLQRWHFSRVDGRGLAPVLIRDYATQKRLRLDPRLYSYETQDVTKTVSEIAAIIRQNHRFYPI